MAVERVLMVSPEYFGHAMAGGLAMAVTGLSKALVKKGIDVQAIVPSYNHYSEFYCFNGVMLHGVPNTELMTGYGEPTSGADAIKSSIYKKEDPRAYGAAGKFSGAISQIVERLSKDWTPDVIHLHEWQSAAAAKYLKEKFPNIPVVVTTHNANYIGSVPSFLDHKRDLPLVGIEVTAIQSGNQLFRSLLEMGVYHADAATTVSPNYVAEILKGKVKIDPLLLQRLNDKGLEGILNGMDTDLMNPLNNNVTFTPYDPKDIGAVAYGKGINKLRLHQRVGMSSSTDSIHVTMLARLVEQKGADLVMDLVEELERIEGISLLIAGEPDNNGLRRKLLDLKGKTKSHLGFVNEDLRHLILAGSDAMLIPSRYEPCCFVQMEGMAYGALPIHTNVGGLVDSVTPIEQGGCGFTIKHTRPDSILKSLIDARDLYRNKERWGVAVRSALDQDFSWDGPRDSIGKYLELYNRLVTKP